jgi:lipopolysaccharide export system protein LptA
MVAQKMALIFVTVFLLASTSQALPSSKKVSMDFRCGSMKVFSKPNHTICNANVVVRRGNLLLCCERFEGEADANWQWQKFYCHGDVRALRDEQLIWADEGEFFFVKNQLHLYGAPLLQRGKSMLRGDRAVMDLKTEDIHIEKARGFVQQAEIKQKQPVPVDKTWTRFLIGELPSTCPLPNSPKGRS